MDDGASVLLEHSHLTEPAHARSTRSVHLLSSWSWRPILSGCREARVPGVPGRGRAQPTPLPPEHRECPNSPCATTSIGQCTEPLLALSPPPVTSSPLATAARRTSSPTVLPREISLRFVSALRNHRSDHNVILEPFVDPSNRSGRVRLLLHERVEDREIRQEQRAEQRIVDRPVQREGTDQVKALGCSPPIRSCCD